MAHDLPVGDGDDVGLAVAMVQGQMVDDAGENAAACSCSPRLERRGGRRGGVLWGGRGHARRTRARRGPGRSRPSQARGRRRRRTSAAACWPPCAGGLPAPRPAAGRGRGARPRLLPLRRLASPWSPRSPSNSVAPFPLIPMDAREPPSPPAGRTPAAEGSGVYLPLLAPRACRRQRSLHGIVAVLPGGEGRHRHGGGVGIGRSISIEFARAGVDVVIASRKMEHLESDRRRVRQVGRRSFASVDVRQEDAVKDLWSGRRGTWVTLT